MLKPLEPKFKRGLTGPIWMRGDIDGAHGHASGDFGKGADTIHNTIKIIQSLDILEERWNDRKTDYLPFDRHPNRIHFNIGRIEGVEWPSSMSADCWFEVCIAIYPGQSRQKAYKKIRRFIFEQTATHTFLKNHFPRFHYKGILQKDIY
ncbi:peptidase dimerization domain-containing protein [Bartonella tamiae]|uniref:peptidase dimerization domain-containing protein n=1 Tax=Bartonella tamiae TaxID=373638 RepID=UPI002473CAD7|nr:peptidase dimerization domain-containing protein [Bartonella tamiae]